MPIDPKPTIVSSFCMYQKHVECFADIKDLYARKTFKNTTLCYAALGATSSSLLLAHANADNWLYTALQQTLSTMRYACNSIMPLSDAVCIHYMQDICVVVWQQQLTLRIWAASSGLGTVCMPVPSTSQTSARPMDQRPLSPEASSADPRKKTGSSLKRSYGLAPVLSW